MGSSRTGEGFVRYEASRSIKDKHGSEAWDYTLLFPALQVTGEGRWMCCSGRGQLERVSTFIRFLLLLETASFFSGNKLHILFIFCAEQNGSGALMGMFLSNVVFPPPASGTVTFFFFFFHIFVAISQTICSLYAGKQCHGSPSFA